MAFTTDIVAIDLRRYPHSPALLADLAREGYELFNPEGMVLFRRHNRLASQPVAPPADISEPATPEPAPAPEQPSAAAPKDDTVPGPPIEQNTGPTRDAHVVASAVRNELLKMQRDAAPLGFR